MGVDQLVNLIGRFKLEIFVFSMSYLHFFALLN
jgi:hypothetical protein